jgi:hypothetical protein
MPPETSPDAVRICHVARDDLQRFVVQPKGGRVANYGGHSMAVSESDLRQQAPDTPAGAKDDQLHSALPLVC